MVKGAIAGCLALALLAGCERVQMRMPSFLRPTPPVSAADAAEASVLVPYIQEAAAERGLRGTILRVRGVTPTQGYFDAELRPIGAEGGVVLYEFRAKPPLEPQAVGPERTRLLTAADFLSVRELRDITNARIVGAGNSVSVPLR
jgi:hypothetical protein